MSPVTREAASRRAVELFDAHCTSAYRRTDRLFAYLMPFQFLAGVICAIVISPRAWAGGQSHIHVHVWAAIGLGGAIASLPVLLAFRMPGRPVTRHTIAVGQMLTSALLIHLSGGRIETHFHVFGSLAFLAFYRDWKVFIPATLVVAFDHLIRGIFWPESVYGVLSASPWRFLEHAAWVLFEDAFLIRTCVRSVQEMKLIAHKHARLESTNQLIEEQVRERTAALVKQTARLKTEVAERRRAEDALRRSEAETRAILDNAPDGIITANNDASIITSINPAGARTFGYSPDELQGRPLTTIIPHRFRSAHLAGVSRYRATGRMTVIGKVVELFGLHSAGHEFPIELRLAAAHAGEETLYTASVRDISDRKRSERVERERNALRDAVKAHEQVLGVVGHELRTPLAAIRAMSEFLLDENASQSVEGHRFLNSIHEQVQQMAEMVNDLLEVARLNSGTAQWNWVEVALQDACTQAVHAVRNLVDPARVALSHSVTPDGLKMNGDADAIRRLMTSLLSNACKYTKAGVVAVHINELTEADARQIRIEVSDTGEGMSPEVADRLGTPFALNSGMIGESHVRGSGLGMNICQGIVAAHGGSMSITTSEGKGTTVTVLLAADLARPAPMEAAAETICQVDG